MNQTAQLFITCILDTLYPQAGEAVVSVLQRAGVEIKFPTGQTCCGQPAFNAGMRAQARRMAIQTIQVFEADPSPVIIPSGSCCAMIRHSYPELFAGDPEWLPRAQALAARCYEFTEYLVDVLGVIDVGARFPGRVAYHSSCHLTRELGVKRQPRLLLESVRDCELVDLPYTEDCCGFGGVFSLEHPELSAAMLERKIANIQASQAPVVVACDSGCLTHINGGLHRRGLPHRVRYIAEILDRK